jgi:rfaE bifunctional protein kinase chain/domain
MFKSDAKIAVIGDVGLDVYRHGKAPRLCPEAPVPIFQEESVKKVPGLAANVAQNITSLGGEAELITVMGDSLELLYIVDGIVSSIQDPHRKSTVKTRFMVGNHFLLRQDEETTELLHPNIEDKFIEMIKIRLSSQKFDAIVLSDYAKGVLTPKVCEAVIQAANGVPVIVDPKPREDYHKYSGATVITPNTKEAKELCLLSGNTDINGIASDLRLNGIILTQGEKGLLVYESSTNSEFHVKALERKVYDVCGAGDTVVAALALGLASGKSMKEAAEIANVAASIVVGKLGTSTVTLEELKAEM